MNMFRKFVPSSLICAMGFSALLGTAASAGEYDPYLPRVEKVKDTDGSVWEVLITPRPLRPRPVAHHIVTPHPIAPDAMVKPPYDEPSEKPAIPTPPPVKEPADDTPDPDEAPTEPAKAEKAGEELVLVSVPSPLVGEGARRADEGVDSNMVAIVPMFAEEETKEYESSNDFGVEIVPRFPIAAAAPSAPIESLHCPPEAPCGMIHPDHYQAIYERIPFNRSEYIANPSYRHEATMEILFGKMRPTVVHKHPGRPRPHETQFPYENDIIRPYSYYSLGAGSGYQRGPLPFATPGAYGVNYNFYYPMPTVYRSY